MLPGLRGVSLSFACLSTWHAPLRTLASRCRLILGLRWLTSRRRLQPSGLMMSWGFVSAGTHHSSWCPGGKVIYFRGYLSCYLCAGNAWHSPAITLYFLMASRVLIEQRTWSSQLHNVFFADNCSSWCEWYLGSQSTRWHRCRIGRWMVHL